MSDQGTHETIDALMAENRTFPPSEDFKDNALVAGTFLYDEAAEDDEGFWARQARELLHWNTPWDSILDWQLPYANTFNKSWAVYPKPVNSGCWVGVLLVLCIVGLG